MQLEYVNQWVPFEMATYADLEAAVAAGPVIGRPGVGALGALNRSFAAGATRGEAPD
jgi:hypothetical protein